MKKFEEKTIKTEEIFKGKIINVTVDDVVLPNGQKSKRELVRHPGAVAIIAVTKEKKLVMVEQYRKPLEKSILEIPAGKLEPEENHAVTARRELEEETGFTSADLEYVTSFYTSPGFADELLHIYYTDQLEVMEEKRELDEDEFVEVHEYNLSELKALQESGRIHDVKTVFAIQYLQLRHLQ
ncbi:NUDIX hydrolase [Amphibacillus cookii]|uniref:NUDIX hydrolase n=1 Tax=Amphibacillus cookii TaxID=767787 RepID=UPI00195F189F|nr:NUDIX hydrolase [Amphibacillus cookii]MBM7542466.1 ADP-ribose pyrophosphatase [Amphibacillus cookii]